MFKRIKDVITMGLMFIFFPLMERNEDTEEE